MDIVSLLPVYPEGNLLFTREENALSSTFNLAARTTVVQYCKRPTWRSLLAFLAHPLSFGKRHQLPGLRSCRCSGNHGNSDAQSGDLANFAYSSGSFRAISSPKRD